MFTFLAVWILTLSAVFFLVLVLPVPAPKRHPLVIVVALAALARFVPLFIFRHQTGLYITDINDYHIVAEAVLRRQDAYVPRSFIFIHPYLPFQMYILAAADCASGRLGATFFTMVRLPHVCADIGIVALIFKASRDLFRDERIAFQSALAYAICPFPIMVGVYHGQFDSLSVFFAMSSWVIITGKPGQRGVLAAGILLSFGALEKTWPVFLLPVLLAQIDSLRLRITYAVASIGFTLTACAVYLIAFSASLSLLIKRTTQYRGPPNIDGHTLILDQLSHVYPSVKHALAFDNRFGPEILLFAIAAATAIQLPRRQPLSSVICVVLALLAATTNGGSYHYLWLVPFAIVARQRMFLGSLIAFAAARDLIIAFLGGGIYFGVLIHPSLNTFVKHDWIIGAAEWSVLMIWFAVSLYQAFPRRLHGLLAGYRRLLLLDHGTSLGAS